MAHWGGAVVPKKARCEFDVIVGVELCDVTLFTEVATWEVWRTLADWCTGWRQVQLGR